MLQDLNESSQNSITQRVQHTTQTHNHGEDEPEPIPSRQLSSGEGRVRSRPPAGARARSEASSEGSGDGAETTIRELSISQHKTGSLVDKISEHERASNHSHKKKRDGPAFAVVSRAKKLGGTRGSIADFPNGTIKIMLSDAEVADEKQRSLLTCYPICLLRLYPMSPLCPNGSTS